MFKSSLKDENSNEKETKNSEDDKRLTEDLSIPQKELSLSSSNEQKEHSRANKIFILHENLRIKAEKFLNFLFSKFESLMKKFVYFKEHGKYF